MVNIALVNAGALCFPRAHIRDFLLDSGRSLRFKNPVKYSTNSRINHETVHSLLRTAHAICILCNRVNVLAGDYNFRKWVSPLRA